MKIHKEGYKTILLVLLLLIIINLAITWFFSETICLKFLLFGTSILLLSIFVYFFRTPVKRKFKYNENMILSPADGVIVSIEDIQETEYFNEKRQKISIFLSPFNMHINWFSVSGKVIYSKYHKGKYLMAFNSKSSEKNERASVVIQTKNNDEIMIRQIAGFLARRIVCYAKQGQTVKQGAELGFIKFGSRVDIFLPIDYKIEVKTGQKVRGMQTVLAIHKQEQPKNTI